jgi:integrase
MPNYKFGFTDTALKKIKPETARVEYVDSSRKGLRLRVTPTGTKTFIYRYKFNGRSRLYTIGEYGVEKTLEEAAIDLATARNQIKNKIDPGELKQTTKSGERSAPVIPDLIDSYINRYAKKEKKTWRDDERMLNKDVLPYWKYKKVQEITSRDIVLLLDKIEKRSVSARNHLQTVISRMFRFAVNNRHWISSSPAIGIDRIKEKPRDRYLYDFEICIFHHKLKDAAMSNYLKTALLILLVTGQRRGELAFAKWENVDLVKKQWFIPETKNGHDHLLPLSDYAVELFEQLKNQTRPSAYVLPSPHLQIQKTGTSLEDKPVTDRSLTRALANNRDYFEMEHFTVHDLRRTAVTKMNSLGIDSRIVERVVNHLPPKLERTYNLHDYFEQKREALGLWAFEIKRITGVDKNE